MNRVVALMLAVAVSVGIMEYSAAMAWFAARGYHAAALAYTGEVEQTPAEKQDELLTSATEYNQRLITGNLDTETPAARGEYWQQLRVADSDALGYLQIDKLGLDVPIFRGTDDVTLGKGVGHQYGTTLPVGGKGTHAVLAGHSGLIHAEMFTHLETLTFGDTFTIVVVGQRLTYQVDRIDVVDPAEVESIDLDPDADLVTLVTCTPTGVNSHRLMVRGHRITPDLAATGAPQYEPQLAKTGPGFPWWLLIWLGSIMIAGTYGKVTGRDRGTIAVSICGDD